MTKKTEVELILGWVFLRTCAVSHQGRSANEEGDSRYRSTHLLIASVHSPIFGASERPCYKLSFLMAYRVMLASEKPSEQRGVGRSEA